MVLYDKGGKYKLHALVEVVIKNLLQMITTVVAESRLLKFAQRMKGKIVQRIILLNERVCSLFWLNDYLLHVQTMD